MQFYIQDETCTYLHVETHMDIMAHGFIIGNHMGVSENSVRLNPMVNDHYPY